VESEIAIPRWRKARAEPSRAARKLTLDWMMHCADPITPRTPAPPIAPSPNAANDLVAQAAAHGVLPAVLRNFRPFQDDPAFAAAKSAGQQRYRTLLAMSLMLAQHADALMGTAARLPVAIVKGPTFARTIYPGVGARPYTDLDLLVAPEADTALAQVLESEGFLPANQGDIEGGERKWVHRRNEALLVEVHTNLVHAPSMRGSMSLTFSDIAGLENSPAAQLIVAVIHGSLGGHFEQVRNLADICQAARAVATAADERVFQELVAKTGARLAARIGLELAGRLFNEPRCLEIAEGLGPVRFAGLASLLIDRTVVLSTMSADRWVHSWRRQAFRQLLKWSAGAVSPS
jgi:hypothetical protein